MDFSEKELILIKRASIKINPNVLIRIFVLVSLFSGACAYLLGFMEIKYFIYLAYFISAVLIVAIGMRPRRPSYNSLVNLLVSKSETKSS